MAAFVTVYFLAIYLYTGVPLLFGAAYVHLSVYHSLWHDTTYMCCHKYLSIAILHTEYHNVSSNKMIWEKSMTSILLLKFWEKDLRRLFFPPRNSFSKVSECRKHNPDYWDSEIQISQMLTCSVHSGSCINLTASRECIRERAQWQQAYMQMALPVKAVMTLWKYLVLHYRRDISPVFDIAKSKI